VAIVFLPMVAGDDRPAAVAQARHFAEPRVSCFWDGERTSGRTWGAAHRGRVVPQLLQVIPADDPVHAMLQTWDPEVQPVWDFGWFCTAAATWPAGGLPDAVVWCKQFGFRGGEPGSNGFFRGDGSAADVAWSSWTEQFAAGMHAARR
jgi:hypothetical protein